jgi:transposase InsO family protein
MDDYSQASWVFLRAKSDAPVEFEKWATMMQKGTGRTIRTVMFDNAREFVAGRMREFCDEHGIQIITLTPYSPSSNGIAEHLVSIATYGTCAMLCDSALLP